MKKKANFWLIVAGIGFGLLAVYLFIKPQFSNQSADLAASIGGWLSLLLSTLSIIKLVKDLVTTKPPAPAIPVNTSVPTVASNNINAPINARNVVLQVNQGSNDTTVADRVGNGKYPEKKVAQKKSASAKAKRSATAKKTSSGSKKTGTARKATA